jgi:L-ascorbate metabolism protein UlaG (beta-lactamase superfamily)
VLKVAKKRETDMKITWLGHASFRIEIEDQVLLIDPWLEGNPSFKGHDRAKAISAATAILITHAHGDHASEAEEIARELDIPIACIAELGDIWETAGVKTIGFNKGGTITLGKITVTMVNAVHSSTMDFKGAMMPAGSEAGFMISGEGHTIYVSGDTDVTSDMGLWAELHEPNIGILNCGGHYTMDMKRAAYAARKFFKFETVIASHYRTFPLLAQDASVLKAGLPDVKVIEPEVMKAIEFALKR